MDHNVHFCISLMFSCSGSKEGNVDIKVPTQKGNVTNIGPAKSKACSLGGTPVHLKLSLS